MTFNVSYDLALPSSVYAALHGAVTTVQDGDGGGLLLHLGRATAKGFEIIEIWDSRESFERFLAETMPRAMALLPGAADMPAPEPPAEFELLGLTVFATGNVFL